MTDRPTRRNRAAPRRPTHRDLILRGGTVRAEQVTCTLLARGWNAEVIHHPTLMVETTAPAKACASAFDAR